MPPHREQPVKRPLSTPPASHPRSVTGPSAPVPSRGQRQLCAQDLQRGGDRTLPHPQEPRPGEVCGPGEPTPPCPPRAWQDAACSPRGLDPPVRHAHAGSCQRGFAQNGLGVACRGRGTSRWRLTHRAPFTVEARRAGALFSGYNLLEEVPADCSLLRRPSTRYGQGFPASESGARAPEVSVFSKPVLQPEVSACPSVVGRWAAREQSVGVASAPGTVKGGPHRGDRVDGGGGASCYQPDRGVRKGLGARWGPGSGPLGRPPSQGSLEGPCFLLLFLVFIKAGAAS